MNGRLRTNNETRILRHQRFCLIEVTHQYLLGGKIKFLIPRINIRLHHNDFHFLAFLFVRFIHYLTYNNRNNNNSNKQRYIY